MNELKTSKEPNGELVWDRGVFPRVELELTGHCLGKLYAGTEFVGSIGAGLVGAMEDI